MSEYPCFCPAQAPIPKPQWYLPEYVKIGVVTVFVSYWVGQKVVKRLRPYVERAPFNENDGR